MIIAECISSDTNYTIEDANKHIETLEAIVAAFNSEEELPEELEKLKPQLEGFIKNGPKALIDPEDFFGAEE
jgi:hypothetical protein